MAAVRQDAVISVIRRPCVCVETFVHTVRYKTNIRSLNLFTFSWVRVQSPSTDLQVGRHNTDGDVVFL